MAEKSVSKNLEDQVTCPICLGQYQEPRILPCLHTYCKKCLKDLLDNYTRNSFRCPECNAIHQVKDVASFPTNIWVNRSLSLLDLARDAENSKSGDQHLLCNSCDSQEPAISRCFDCELVMCKGCKSFHERMAITRDHNAMSFEDIMSKGVPPTEKIGICEKHKGKKMKLFCKDCKKLICKDCIVIDHKDHDFAFIQDVIDDQKSKLEEWLGEIGFQRQGIVDSINKIQDVEIKLKKNAADIEGEIDKIIDAKIQTFEKIRAVQKEKLREMVETKEDRLTSQQNKLQEKLTSFSSTEEFTQNMLAKGSPSDVLSMVGQITDRCKELRNMKVDDKVYREDGIEVIIYKQVNRDDDMMTIKDRSAPDPLQSKANGQCARQPSCSWETKSESECKIESVPLINEFERELVEMPLTFNDEFRGKKSIKRRKPRAHCRKISQDGDIFE